ncbi:SCP2 sterol-binding domain-containing protein [Streptomyces sp. NPDC051567]|uniref:SCP2 sterol-binding domain-containing protein n=1 Tax=Streptomyces sp. NPDC051567 TaxID=3365660 RepID=UPI003792226F
MATIQECREALDRLSGDLTRSGDGARGTAGFDRSLSCHVTDLDQTFTGRLDGGRLRVATVTPGPPAAKAEIRLAMTGDDLLALVAGELRFARAWASGRIRLEAGFRDLLRLKSLL